MDSLRTLLNKLRLTNKKGLFYFNQSSKWENRFSYSLKNVLKAIRPDAFYYLKRHLFILFFVSPTPEKEKALHKQIWNFNQAPVVFIIKSNQVLIYNGFHLDKTNHCLDKIGDDKDVDNFSFWNLQSDNVWKRYQNSFKNETRIDYYLLDNIETGLDFLKQEGLDKTIANNLIGRLIFSRYLIDREIRVDVKYINGNDKAEREKSLLTLINDKQKLYRYFEYLKNKFNGNLFPLKSSEATSVTHKHLKILYRLFNSEELKTDQPCLFDVYDFSIIPIELISNIYERFIGGAKQEANKAFYTPQFLVNYILSQTITPFLEKKNTTCCRTLDPACGSGIFLVETLRKIIEKELGRKRKISDERLKKLLKDNIFGIDKDEDAINVAIFSLYITLLDYKEPKSIQNFKLPILDGINFFKTDFFDFSVNKKLKGVKFDFIIGNPPWGAMSGTHVDYCKEQNIPISDNQIAQAFLARTKDFSCKNTKCSLIVSGKILYNLKAKYFRKYFLEKFNVSQVFELSAVRRQIFKAAIGPAAIVFYQYAFGKETYRNIIRHISLKPNLFFKLFKAIVIEKYDDKEITQGYFGDNDWLWKTLLYGNVLDFNFIKRLKKYSQLEKIITENNLYFGAGFIRGGNHRSSELKDFKLVTDELISPYFINIKNASPLGVISFHRKGTIEVYTAPHLLIKRSINEQPVLAYLNKDCTFPNTIYGLSGEESSKNILKNIGSLLASKLTTYFHFLTSSQWGVERDEVYKEEYLQLPVSDNMMKSKMHKQFDKISIAAKNKHNTKVLFDNTNYDKMIRNCLGKTNKTILSSYHISDSEQNLIDYAVNVSIPMHQNKEEPYKNTSHEQLKEYATIFKDYFCSRFNRPKEYFQIDIYPAMDKYFIAMHFKVIKSKPRKAKIINFLDNDTTSATLTFFNRLLSTQKITEQLFMQKDIKGFERDSFYIIKPDEHKNWHPAMARLDLYEFMDAILKSGAKQSFKD